MFNLFVLFLAIFMVTHTKSQSAGTDAKREEIQFVYIFIYLSIHLFRFKLD